MSPIRRYVHGFIAMLIVVVFTMPASTFAAGTLDQEYDPSPWGGDWHSFGPTYPLAQTFTAGVTGSLAQVDLYIAIFEQDHPGTLTVQIQSLDSNGLPSGTVLGSGTVPESSVGAAWGWVSIPLSAPAPVTAGTRYALVVFSEFLGLYKIGSACHNPDWCSSSVSPDYAGGEVLGKGGGWYSLTKNYDLLFRTYVMPASDYTFSGFFAPIDNTAPNAAKAGQTIPIKWRLTDANGLPISDPASFVSVTSTTTSSACSGTPDTVEEYAGSSGLQYLGDGYWQFNWKTPKSYAGQCRTMRLTLGDGTSHTAAFTFK